MYLVISNKLNNELKKSLGNNSKLDYFKNKLLAILDKKEKEEEKEFHKSWDDIELMQKSRAMPVGTIQTWKGKKFKKMPNKKWVRVYDTRNRSAEISIARLKGKVRRATSVDELFEIVSNNIHRFEDENGRTLDIVQELKAEVDKAKGVINKDKPKFDYEGAKWDKEYKELRSEAEEYLKNNKQEYPYKKLTKLQNITYSNFEFSTNTNDNFDVDSLSEAMLKALWEKLKYNLQSVCNGVIYLDKKDKDSIAKFKNSIKVYKQMINKLEHAKNWNKEAKKKKKNSNNKYNNFDFDSLPDIFKLSQTKNTFKNLGEYLNSIEIKDNRIKTIIQNFGKAVTRFGEERLKIIMVNKVLTGKKCNCWYDPMFREISIPKFLDFNKKDYASTIIHEFGHRLDEVFDITYNKDEPDFFKQENEIREISDEVKETIDLRGEELYKKYTELVNNVKQDFKSNPQYLIDKKIMKNYTSKIDELDNKYHAEIRERKGINDIYDALSGGVLFSKRVIKAGHGRDYYHSDNDKKKQECFANFFQLKLEHPEQLEILKKDKPEVYNYLDSCIDDLYNNYMKHSNNYNN